MAQGRAGWVFPRVFSRKEMGKYVLHPRHFAIIQMLPNIVKYQIFGVIL
jgi:hypothetical protein